MLFSAFLSASKFAAFSSVFSAFFSFRHYSFDYRGSMSLEFSIKEIIAASFLNKIIKETRSYGLMPQACRERLIDQIMSYLVMALVILLMQQSQSTPGRDVHIMY